jgi:hypothetical protein
MVHLPEPSTPFLPQPSAYPGSVAAAERLAEEVRLRILRKHKFDP